MHARRGVRALWECGTTTREPVQYNVAVAVSAVPPVELPTAASAPPEASFRRLMKKAPFSNARTIPVIIPYLVYYTTSDHLHVMEPNSGYIP